VEDRTARFGIEPFNGQVKQIWQGTILEGGGVSPPLRRLVISADCDIAKDKGSGEFFVMDILRVEKFAERVLLSDGRADLVCILIEMARETAKSRNSSFSEVSDEVLAEWLVESEDGRWESDLPNLHANEKDLLLAIRTSVLRFIRKCEDGDKEPAPRLLVECTNQQMIKKVEQLNKRLKAAFQKRLEPSRVDLYILPPMPGETNTVGHVVPFKSLTLMSRSQVCMGRMDLVERPNGFTPLATCRPILLQSLLQKMTTYFARIGLTDTFKAEQSTVVKNLLESMR
jgi:hypothetical protein